MRTKIIVIGLAMASSCCGCLASDPLNSWNLVYSNSPFPIASMAYGNGTFIGVGDGFDLISHNGSNWSVSETSPVINSGGIAYGDGMFMAFGTNNQHQANYILQSTNQTTWAPIYISSNTLIAAAYGNNRWVFIGTNDIATATLTSSNWNWSEYQPSFSPICICYANGNFVIGAALMNGQSIFSSSDGITWQYDASLKGGYYSYGVGSSYYLPGIAYGNGVFVTTSLSTNGPLVFVSSNLVQWVPVFTNVDDTDFPVAYGGGEFVISDTYPSLGFLGVLTSSNSHTWTTNFFGGSGLVTTLTYGQGTFVACDSYSIYQSGVFATVSNPPPATLAISTYPGVTINGKPGLTYQVQYTTNLNSTWLPLATFVLPYTPYIWVDTSSLVVGKRFYQAVQIQ